MHGRDERGGAILKMDASGRAVWRTLALGLALGLSAVAPAAAETRAGPGFQESIVAAGMKHHAELNGTYDRLAAALARYPDLRGREECELMGHIVGRQALHIAGDPDRASAFATIRLHFEMIAYFLDVRGRLRGACVNAFDFGLHGLSERFADLNPSSVYAAPPTAEPNFPTGTAVFPERTGTERAAPRNTPPDPPPSPTTATPAGPLDGTYRWTGHYSDGTVRTVDVRVEGLTVAVTETNAFAIPGKIFEVTLFADGPATTDADGQVSNIEGGRLSGAEAYYGASQQIVGGAWSFSSRDGGRTFALSWQATNGDFGGFYVFGPTGDEFQHGAASAAADIRRARRR